jgi:hypothetical protein
MTERSRPERPEPPAHPDEPLAQTDEPATEAPASFPTWRCPEPPDSPVLQCGKTGDDPSFERGADCWLGMCMGNLAKLPRDAVWLEDASGRRVPGRVEPLPPMTFSFVSKAPLTAGKHYRLVLRTDAIRNDEGLIVTVKNGNRASDKTVRFCFDPGEDPMNRNGSAEHGCTSR